MGDRHVIGFRKNQESPTIYLYSHWGGEDRFKTAVEALEAARPRWSQDDYATRIAISTIVGNQWSEETGFGISVDEFCMPDWDEVIVIEWETKTVFVYRGDQHETLKFDVSLSFDFFTMNYGS